MPNAYTVYKNIMREARSNAVFAGVLVSYDQLKLLPLKEKEKFLVSKDFSFAAREEIERLSHHGIKTADIKKIFDEIEKRDASIFVCNAYLLAMAKRSEEPAAKAEAKRIYALLEKPKNIRNEYSYRIYLEFLFRCNEIEEAKRVYEEAKSRNQVGDFTKQLIRQYKMEDKGVSIVVMDPNTAVPAFNSAVAVDTNTTLNLGADKPDNKRKIEHAVRVSKTLANAANIGLQVEPVDVLKLPTAGADSSANSAAGAKHPPPPPTTTTGNGFFLHKPPLFKETGRSADMCGALY